MLFSSTFPFISLLSDVPLIVAFIFLALTSVRYISQFFSSQQQTDVLSPPPPLSPALFLYTPLSSPMLEIELFLFCFSQLNVSMAK